MKVLVCGVLPPPYFGHSVMYKMLMESAFPEKVQVRFLNMHFWSYQTNKQVTGQKLFLMAKYFFQYIAAIILWQPRFVLYNSSFYRMPFWKDSLFCAVGIVLGRGLVFHDMGQYVRELHDTLPAWQRRLLRWTLRHAAGSILMGEGVRQTYKGLMDDNKLFPVPGVVEDTRGLDVKADRPAGGWLNVLYFSHMSRPKGVYVAFDAAAEILAVRQDVMVSFAGPFENEDVSARLELLKKEYPGRVRYLGYIEKAEQRTAIYRGADVFMFTTIREAFGLVLLHAMAEGKPVVASREGTIPEIVQDGQTGYLFEKGNAEACAAKVLEILDDPQLRERMGVQGRRRFEDFYTLKRYGDQMVSAFEAMDRPRNPVLSGLL